jgi:GTP-binding protein
MYEYLKYYGLDGIVVATKADKVGNNQKASCIKTIRQTLGMNREDKVIPVSALKKTGDEELLEVITSLL